MGDRTGAGPTGASDAPGTAGPGRRAGSKTDASADGPEALAVLAVLDGPDAPAVLDGRWLRSAAVALARHPSLWLTAVRQALLVAAPGWWRRRPFLPLPPTDYLRFRLQTAYGGAGERPPEPDDLVTYLHWCRRFG
jgi:hypothetical protein